MWQFLPNDEFAATVEFIRLSLCEGGGIESETLPETTESGPLCITDLFQNKSVAYF